MNKGRASYIRSPALFIGLYLAGAADARSDHHVNPSHHFIGIARKTYGCKPDVALAGSMTELGGNTIYFCTH